ncbi:MAG TPA: MFS transporter [Bacillota bacterium]|nr:MFS transporter [Bacillota bacterium]
MSQVPLAAARRGMRMSVIEGSLYSLWFGLLAGNYLTGLLLHLHATGFDLGVAAALPSLAMLPQVGFVAWVRSVADRRWICGGLGALHRLGWALGGLLALFLKHPWDLIVFECCYGVAWLGQGPINVAWAAYMDDIVAMPVRGRYFGWRTGVTQAAALVGVLIGGWILQAQPGTRGFAFLLLAGLLAGAANVAMWPLHPRVPAPARAAPPPDRAPGESVASHRGPHRRAAVFFAVWMFVQSLAVPFYPVALLGPLRLNFGELALLSAAAGLATVLAAAAVGRWQDRRGELEVSSYGMALLAAPPLLLWAALRGGVPVLVLAHVMFGVGTGLVMVSSFTLNLRLAPAGDREGQLAVWYAASGLGSLVAPLLAGPLTLRNIWPLFAAASTCSLVLACVWRWWLGPSCLGPAPRLRVRGAARPRLWPT